MLSILYLDETGHAADRDKLHVGIAGLLAPMLAWEQFDVKWPEILQEFEIRSPFHMKQFASQKDQFKNWKEEKRRALLGALVNLIVDITDVRPIGAVVCMQAYRELSEPEQKKLGDPYFIALESCIRKSMFTAVLEGRPDINAAVSRIRIVLAKNTGFSGPGMDLWEAMRQFDVLGLTGLFMESIVPGTPAEYPGIQAADLVCYEVGKFFNYSLPRKKKPRWAYKQVSSLPNSFLHFGKKELRSLLDTPNITAEGIAYSVL